MNTERIQQRLGVETSKKSVNTDTFLKINLDGEQRLLQPDEINKVVNVGDRFDLERQRSKFYRIIGTINPTVSNVLFNLNDPAYLDVNTWSGFNQLVFLDTSYPRDNNLSDLTDATYSIALKSFLKEKEGWFGYYDPDITKSGLCNYFDMEPTRNRFTFTPDIKPFHANTGQQPVKNWELTITYPAHADTSHIMVNGGLLIAEVTPAIVATRNMTGFGMPCLHNLNTGDVVRITGSTGYDGDHVVVRTGLDDGDLKGYYFVIDKPYSASTIGAARMKRMFGDVESQYYFRKFKKVKTRTAPLIETDDYEAYKLAFSENVFYDNLSQFVFNEDIDVSDLTDNLGRPISELYLTVVKTDSNQLFGSVSSGIETPYLPILTTSNVNTYLLNIPTINRIHNGGSTPFISSTPLESSVTINPINDEFYGDVVDYNSNQVQETILAHVSHRFNTLNRETGPTLNYVSSIGITPITTPALMGPRQEGYFYKAHHLIRIREFSSYVEQGDQFTEGIPSYAVNLGDGRYLWRDLLDIGFNETTENIIDYPFLNGSHYMYNNYCFSVRRQDPFDNWDLFWSNFPADPIGERMTDKFNSNSAEDVC